MRILPEMLQKLQTRLKTIGLLEVEIIILKRVFRQQKVAPFIFFLLCSLISMTAAGYGIYMIVELAGSYT